MRTIFAGVILCLAVGRAAAADVPAGDRMIHRYQSVQISPNGELVASVEGDSSASGGAPTIRSLVIRHVRGGAPLSVAMPCGNVPMCWPESPTWSPDGKQLSFALRSPGTHARSV